MDDKKAQTGQPLSIEGQPLSIEGHLVKGPKACTRALPTPRIRSLNPKIGQKINCVL